VQDVRCPEDTFQTACGIGKRQIVNNSFLMELIRDSSGKGIRTTKAIGRKNAPDHPQMGGFGITAEKLD
jgi:hypothetical protein